MGLRILPSTGAFIGRVNGRDHRPLLSVIDTITAEAYEFMMYESFYGREEAVLSDFLSTGLAFPVFHIEKRVGELIGLGGEEEEREARERFLKNCRAAARLGAETLVFHLWNGLPSDRAFSRHLAFFGECDRVAREHGLLLTVENVVCAVGDPHAHFAELLAAYPDIAFTFDTKMAAFHRGERGFFTSAATAPLAARVRHIHFNDYNGVPGDFSKLAVLHLGEGNIDIARFAAGLRAVGYHGTVTLECGCMRPDGTLTPEKMNASLALARGLLIDRKE
jgi:sugar phosphate isomerase/epimerase